MADTNENHSEATPEAKKDKIPLEELPREDLLKQAKRYFTLLQTAKKKYSELGNKCRNLEKERDVVTEILTDLKSKNQVSSVEELQTKIDELEKYQQLAGNTSPEAIVLQEQLWNQEKENLLRKSRESEEQIQCMQMQLDTLRETCQCLQEEVSKLTLQNKDFKNEIQVLTNARDTALQALKSVTEELSSSKALSQTQMQELEMLKKKEEVAFEKETCLRLEVKDKEVQTEGTTFLEYESSEISKQLRHVLNENQYLKKSLAEAEDAKNILLERNEYLSDIERKYSEMDKICNSLREQVANFDVQCNSFREENLNLKQNYEDICEKNENLQRQIIKQNENIKKSNHEVQSEISELRIIFEEISEKLVICIKEKDSFLAEMQNMLIGTFFGNGVSAYENVSFSEILTAIVNKYNSLQAKVLDFENQLRSYIELEKKAADTQVHMSVKCADYEKEIAVLSEKLENCMQENTTLKLKTEEFRDLAMRNDCLDDEKSRLLLDKSSLSERLENASKEIETLKQQLDEYENDIQKHLNLEKENFDLQDMLKELEKENERLSECYENKCITLDELMTHIDSLIISIKQESDSEISDDIFESKCDSFQNIFILKSLFSEICCRLSNSSEKIKDFETELEDCLKAKQNLYNELIQIQDLKQFLEDEVAELREETEQLRSEAKVEEKHVSEMKDVFVQAFQERNDVSTAVDAALTDEQVGLSTRLLHENSFGTNTMYSALSEWGCTNDSFHSSDNASIIIENLNKENERLESLLETKSSLVEKIHCEVDLLLTKVEVLSLEKEEKECDLQAANALNANLEKQVKDMHNIVCRLQATLKEIFGLISFAKEIKKEVPHTLQEMINYFQETFSNAKSAMHSIQSEYSTYSELIEKYKLEMSMIKKENLYLKENMCWLSDEISTFLKSREENKCRTDITKNHEKNIHLKSDDEISDAESSPYVNYSMEKLTLNINSLKEEFMKMTDQVTKQSSMHIEGYKDAYTQCDNNQVEKELSTAERQIHESSVHGQHLIGTGEQKCSLCDELQKRLSEVETKMNKFKAVAIKLKKELAESKQNYQSLSEVRGKLESRISELSDELNSTSSTHCQYVQNFQNLQMEYDKLQDESENLKSVSKNFQADLVSTLNELNSYKQKFNDVEAELKKVQEGLVLSESEKSNLRSKLSDLESKLIVMECKNSESALKVQGLIDDLSKSQKELSDSVKEKEELNKKLEDALKERKQHSLLDLEMADYERTIAELTEQLEKKSAEIVELKSEAEAHLSKVQGLEEEMKFSINHRLTEEKRADSFKEALENNKKELALLRDHKSTLEDDVAKLNYKVETLVLQEAEYKSQLSQQSAELEKMKEMLRSSGENHQRIVQSLNSKIASQKEDILIAHKEVESVKQDFENYKIRVHSVLKQQKQITPFSTSDTEVKEKLEAENEKLKLQVKDLSEKLLASNLESESLHDEHEHLLQRHDKIVEELEAKDEAWSQRLEQLNVEKNRLQTLLETLTSEHSLKSEMLASTYKKQMKLMQKEHKYALEELQKQVEAADVEIARLQRELQKNNSVTTSSLTQDDSFAFDILSQERQEGEGSECTDGRNTPVRHLSLATIPTSGFLPLEKLLQSPAECHTPTSLISNQDSERLSNELNSSWKKIEHLTELLNESEANNLRWSEQVRVLKEEVRRLERNKQREEHAKNLEYLKNVFIKFVTLHSGSEKARLVPVLNTMLKLSPLELQQLKEAAGGPEEPDAASSGWGNYLHRWSGLI